MWSIIPQEIKTRDGGEDLVDCKKIFYPIDKVDEKGRPIWALACYRVVIGCDAYKQRHWINYSPVFDTFTFWYSKVEKRNERPFFDHGRHYKAREVVIEVVETKEKSMDVEAMIRFLNRRVGPDLSGSIMQAFADSVAATAEKKAA